MCNHITLAENQLGLVLWCKDCNAYVLQFNNVVMTLNSKGLKEFKEQAAQAYAGSVNSPKNRHCKSILFDSKLKGMRFCFSVDEIGSLLLLLQEATIINNDYQD